ncbi:Hok/Gef family protein [Pantoea osteomyelitidis]|uniref:Hok/Gef family protein n=1 Tax=Pantoea osteomyelitidis TaxID=3230026 RepID=A0ABW7PZ38_9GAMM
MKQHSAVFIAVILIIAATSVALVMRKDLCEVRIKTGLTDVAVLMACESVK